MIRIPGLATLTRALIVVCDVIAKHQATVRLFVPPEKQADYDGAVEAIMTGCDIIRSISYLDDNLLTNPRWGTRHG